MGFPSPRRSRSSAWRTFLSPVDRWRMRRLFLPSPTRNRRHPHQPSHLGRQITDTGAYNVAAQLAILDLRTPSMPVVELVAELPIINSAAVPKLFLYGTSVWIASGLQGMVVELDFDAGNAAQTRQVSLPPASRTIAFDGSIVIMAHSTGLDFIDVAANPPLSAGSLPLPTLQTASIVHQDNLVVGCNNGVHLVHPPCPPLVVSDDAQ